MRRCHIVFDGILGAHFVVRVAGQEILVEEEGGSFRETVVQVEVKGGEMIEVDFRAVGDTVKKRRAAGFDYREWNDPVGGISCVRMPQFMAGWDWGPRLLTVGLCGKVKVEFRRARVGGMKVEQTHFDTKVRVRLKVEIEAEERHADEIEVRFKSVVVGEALQWEGRCDGEKEWESGGRLGLARQFEAEFVVLEPQLWWPAGYGGQTMYEVRAEVYMRGKLVDAWSEKIGLRTLELARRSGEVGCRMMTYNRNEKEGLDNASSSQDGIKMSEGRHKDESEGDNIESFTLVVNGRAIFSKGANFIPTHAVHTAGRDEDCEDLIESAVEAGMNMLRVWGGGVYEGPSFYDACDRKGVLVWHDFMFACTLYPGDDSFLAAVEAEATFQTRRLRNRPCMALWCGNNELEQVPHDIVATAARKKTYERLFYQILSRVVATETDIAYWPSSPHNPAGYEKGFNSSTSGDSHFWEVWHARQPVTAYLQHSSRFCSEFGMQSYISEAGAKRFCGEGEALNVFSPVFEAHQKNAGGNTIIAEYCRRLFRAPGSYRAVSYQSQVNQAICIQAGVEHFRRSWPWCAGALYWQLNDVWPCASWSSIEFGGRWKALHFFAKRFFAPLLLSIVHHGSETTGLCNLVDRDSSTGKFSVYACYDGNAKEIMAELSWTLLDVVSGEAVDQGIQSVSLKRDSSNMLCELDFRDSDGTCKRATRLVLCAVLESRSGGSTKEKSEATSWFCSPRFCELPAPSVEIVVEESSIKNGCRRATVIVKSAMFSPFVQLDVIEDDFVDVEEKSGAPNDRYSKPSTPKWSDNYFDLLPNSPRVVTVTFDRNTGHCSALPRISVFSLLDSYMT